MPKISVVIPLYNKAPHIIKAVDSVLAQSTQPDEVIVVDDGSTDGGAELLASRVEKYGVRVIYQTNAGESSARNKGVEIASSDYIAFLDADDWWLPNHLETLHFLIDRYPSASLYSTAHIVEREGQLYRPKSTYNDGWLGVVDDFFYRYAQGLSLINSTTACVRKTDFVAIGGFPTGIRRGPDIICWINMALKYQIAHAEIVTAVYFQDAVNRSNQLREPEPPASLLYIANLLQNKTLTTIQYRGLRRLFDRIAFFTAAGFRVSGDKIGASAINKLSWRARRYRTALLILLLRLLPVELLLMAKKIRHPPADRTLVKIVERELEYATSQE